MRSTLPAYPRAGDLPALRRLPGGWSGITLTALIALIAALAALPLGSVLWIALHPSGGIWGHLAGTVLFRYATTTFNLALGVGCGVLVIGAGSAWLVTMCRFPGRGVFQWLLLLPLAMPAYLAAYAYTDLLEFAGPVQSGLREAFGWSGKRDYWFPEVRSLGGAITFMTLVLYPYVYLLARAAFLEQSSSTLEAGRILGHGPWSSFFSISLPLARPALVVGVLLALMETLNDFGTVDYFAVPTFTVGIFRVWFGMNNAPGAAQLASLLLGVVLVLILLERLARRSRRFHSTSGRARPLPGYTLRGARAWAALLACGMPVTLGFAVPAGVLAWQGWQSLETTLEAGLAGLIFNSILISGLAALACCAVGLFLAYGQRLQPGLFPRAAARAASVGYAVPGAVLAIGVLIPAAWLDNTVDAYLRQSLGISSGLLLSGTVAAVLFAYVVRFLALSFGTLESSLAKITPFMDHAARSLGSSPGGVLMRIHLPLMKGSVLTAGLLVFVDGMKELPMTLILRPFNFNTLATHVYEYASYEAFQEAAPAALAIVAVGLLPVMLLSRTIGGVRGGQDSDGGRI